LSSKSTFSNSTSNSYALALYELSKENSDLERVENEAKGIQDLLNKSSEFKEMVLNPTVTKEDKKKVIFTIAEKNQFSKTFTKFLGFAAFKNRLFFLNKIIESFLNLISNSKGELKANLISSKELSKQEQEKIKNELSENFKSPLKINYKYNPDLIGGLIIQVGSVMVDTSIKTKLKKLKQEMLEV
tara:strand:- start:328 stop:885 length:558 start_codon:yes stop_codon:yes gene_type:complete